MTIEKAVGEELRYCRNQKGLSQEELGFEASLHRTYISLSQFQAFPKNPPSANFMVFMKINEGIKITCKT